MYQFLPKITICKSSRFNDTIFSRVCVESGVCNYYEGCYKKVNKTTTSSGIRPLCSCNNVYSVFRACNILNFGVCMFVEGLQF